MPATTGRRNPTRWVGLNPEDRRAERRTLLLDAGLELLGTEGWAGTTVRAVCQEARLNPRYFYESFADLDELLLGVYDRLVEQLGAAVLAAIAEAGEDARGQVRAALQCIFAFIDGDPRRGRVLYVEALGSEALNRRRIETGHALVGLVEQAGVERHGRPRPGERIGRLTAAILVGGTGEMVAAWLDGRLDGPREQLIDDATELFLAMGDTAATIAASRARRR
ncbi:MAG: TetR/AcrR family transcriptional regulator [Acidimicrobiia bacterium]